jgi:hypothetical protein
MQLLCLEIRGRKLRFIYTGQGSLLNWVTTQMTRDGMAQG